MTFATCSEQERIPKKEGKKSLGPGGAARLAAARRADADYYLLKALVAFGSVVLYSACQT
jgi:hypothetical protein